MTIAKPDNTAPLESMTLRAVFLSGVRICVFRWQKPSSARAKTAPRVQDFGADLFLFFPRVGNFHGAPVGDGIAVARCAVEHSRSAEQADLSTAQGRERPASERLLVSQSHDGINLRSAASGQVVREERHSPYQCSNACESQRVGCRNPKQHSRD